MSLGRVSLVVVVVVLLLGGASFVLWPAESEEDRIREVIRGVVAGAEAADVGEVVDPLAEEFSAESEGHSMDKSMVRALLARQFMRRGPLFVMLGDVEVTLAGDEAHASFDAVLAENSTDLTEVLPVDADAWHLELDLRREADGWVVTRAVRSDAVMLELGGE